MASIKQLEQFIKKWEPSIDGFLLPIRDALQAGGYIIDTSPFDVDEWDDAPWARSSTFIALPGRPEELDYLDMNMDLMLVAEDEPGHNRYTPILDITNNDGGISDDLKLSEVPLRLDDDESWAKVWAQREPLASNIRYFVEGYNPKPTTRIWRIRGTTPGNVPIHPSIHTRKEVAKSEIAERLFRVLEQATKVVWELRASDKYRGSADSITQLMLARGILEQGKPVAALKQYHRFLGSLDAPLLKLINKMAGTLDVEVAGGSFLPEDEDA